MKRKGLIVVLVLFVAFFFGCSDSDDGGGGGVEKSIKITEIPNTIKIAQAGLYTPPATPIAGTNWNEEDENVSGGVLEGDLLVFEGEQLTGEKFTETGSYYIFFNDGTNDPQKRYYSNEKKTINDANPLATLSFVDDFNDFDDDGVPKSIEITGISADIKHASVQLFKVPPTPTNSFEASGLDSSVPASTNLKQELLVPVDDSVDNDSEKWTGTGSYYIFLMDFTNTKGYATPEKVPIKDALTTLPFSALSKEITEE